MKEILDNELSRLESSIKFYSLQIQALELLKFHSLRLTEDKSPVRAMTEKSGGMQSGQAWQPRSAPEEGEDGLYLLGEKECLKPSK
ncbi:MAG: hypothetical protein QXR42_05610 [Candidatus Bathyarchaeia archaeon]